MHSMELDVYGGVVSNFFFFFPFHRGFALHLATSIFQKASLSLLKKVKGFPNNVWRVDLRSYLMAVALRLCHTLMLGRLTDTHTP